MLDVSDTPRAAPKQRPAAVGRYTATDFEHSPFIVFYEVTRACDLVCRHCRACAQPRRDPLELDHGQAMSLIESLATFPKPPLLVLTGGDPLKRDDVLDLVGRARSLGLMVAMTPSATPLVTTDALRRLHAMGLGRLAVSLDGKDAPTHDGLRGVPGSFDRTLEILRDAQQIGLPLQINTTITRRNIDQVHAMAELVSGFGIDLWSLFFLVPVGRGTAEARITPEEYERVFATLWQEARSRPYGIKTTEAPHYRRFVLQHAGDPRRGSSHRAPLGVNDGKGVMFISHTGEIFPSGFLPVPCGRFPQDSVVDVYQRHPTFVALRDADRLTGKCGACEFRRVCGGSRARAFALTGDPFAADADCVHLPVGWTADAAQPS